MSDGRKRLGDWGESVAAVHLEAKGYRIVARKWRCVWGEIDLIVQKQESYRFVEVRTRRGRSWGTPEQSITRRKAETLQKVALAYLSEHDLESGWQIDLIAVVLDSRGKLERCDHLENIVVQW